MTATSPIVLVLCALAACHDAAPAAAPSPARVAADAPALDALRAAHFADAAKLAGEQLAIAPRDAEAAAIRGLAAYVTAADTLASSVNFHHSWFIVDALLEDAAHAPVEAFVAQADAIDRDLDVASADPGFALELCIACWDYDWNHQGGVDDRDRHLLEIELDAHGEPLPDGDPRRRPTFRFDVGDVWWARAMIAFQRAALDLVLAYRWSKADGRSDGVVTIPLVAPERVKAARAAILAGLDFADRARVAYLAETDDDREWVPNPRQHDHPIPLDVDDQLYQTWEGVIGDVRRLVRGDEGISMRDVVALLEPAKLATTPDAFIDLGAMLAEPMDIKIDESSKGGAGAEAILRGLLGHGYREHMKPSPLVARLARMRADLERSDRELGRKLRYLLWLN